MADHEIEVRFPPYPLVAHSDIDNADCCGCLYIEPRGQEAALICNECAAVIRIVPADQAINTLAELSATDMCSETCPHCGNLNIFQGFSVIDAFVCHECGRGVSIKRSVQ